MTRNEILAQYDVTVDGVILDFGKFENEPLYAPYFYEHASDGEELSFMEDGCGAYVSMVRVDDDDRAMFPELPADALYIVVEELDSGFVQIDHITSEAHAAQVRAAYEADECDDMFAPEDGSMIDEATYTDYRARINAFEAWLDTKRTFKNGQPYSISYRDEDMPAEVRALGVTNEMRSAVEVFELHRDKPQKFSAYMRGGNGAGTHVIALFTVVGRVLDTKEWRDRHGNRRYSIRMRADWGGEYVGQTQGAGMYVNLRKVRV